MKDSRPHGLYCLRSYPSLQQPPPQSPEDGDEGSFQAKASDLMDLRWLFAVIVDGPRTAQARDRKERSEVEVGIVPKAGSGREPSVSF